ncbi:MAG: glycosyltransferase family 2 protein [Firmicutes bacterium]|jgi:glycosyltransferase involved in cell wall biosynthesis|nr:glycosyltransferase family 2 protein [Bacillota bacterium]
MVVSAVIPAYNEAGTIGKTVRALQEVDAVDEIIVVDDGSRDGTAQAARDAGALTFSLAVNCGKGQALAVGCAMAKGDILLLLDADLGDSAREAAVLLEPVTAGEADMSIAVLPLTPGEGGFGLVQGLSRWAVKKSGGPALTQPLSGQRAMRRAVWRELGTGSGFGVETALGMGIHSLGYRVVEVQAAMTHRRTGRDLRGMLHRGRQLIHVLLTILRHWRRLLRWGT